MSRRPRGLAYLYKYTVTNGGRRARRGVGQSQPMTSALPDPDPRPEPPVQPDLDACCGNGCEPCIFDLHDLAMDAYRQALRAWTARQPGSGDQQPQ